MSLSGIEIRINKSTAEEINAHLLLCSARYIPPLGTKVNIKEYAKKIRSKAVTFEAIADGELVGLVAAYFNDQVSYDGYITDVSVNSVYTGRGIARVLLEACISFAVQNRFKSISLEVSEDNHTAVSLYEDIGFRNAKKNSGMIIMRLELDRK